MALRELGEIRAFERDLLADGLGHAPEHRHAAPLPAEIDLAAPERDLERAGHRERARLHEIARDLHHRLVVGVGPVELEHRELGVVLPAHALVAEVPPDLVDAFEAAHEQALQVQLERDPQVQVHVEIAVVRHERTRHRPARDRLQDRRLDLDVAVLVQVRADRAQRARARVDQPLPRVGVGREVEGALSLLELGILEAVPLLGQRAEGLGEHREPLDEDRQLALARGPDPAGRTDDVAEIHLREQLAAVRVGVLVDDQLDVARPVAQDQERELAHVPLQDDPAGHRSPGLVDRVVRELAERLPDARRRVGLRHPERLLEVQRERPVAEPLAALASGPQDLAFAPGGLLGHLVRHRRARRCVRTRAGDPRA